jgi:hypothetical protein
MTGNSVTTALAALTELYDAPLPAARSRRRRTEMARVLELGDRLSDRERAAVRAVATLRLATHAQLATLTAGRDSDLSEESAARVARRLLAGLAEAGMLARLQRRIGGIRAGSAGYVYYLGPVGQRLIAYWDGHGITGGRVRPEPGPRFVRHRLMVSQLYVDAHVASQEGALELLAFDVEPDCWRTYLDRQGQEAVLKPDAVVLTRAQGGQRRFLLEVDLATESRTVIERKLRRYAAYFDVDDGHAEQSRVVLVAPTSAREAVLGQACEGLAPADRRRFSVGTLDRAVELLRATSPATAATSERRSDAP